MFYEVFPFGHVDGSIGRQFYDAAEVYAKYRDEGKAGDVLVFALGTNGYVQDSETDALMKEVGPDKHVWLVNTRSNTDYMDSSNAAIKRCADKYDNVELIDWYTVSEQYGSDIFDGDGTHLTPEGCEIYANMILDATKNYLPERSKDPAKARAEKEAQEKEASGEGSSSESASSSSEAAA